MDQLGKYIHLYVGCDTSKGKFIGIKENTLLIQTEEKKVDEYDIGDVGNSLFLYLRQLSEITDEQSRQLNKEGFAIGRPHGYTFSNNGFLFLLSLSVDLFGLINSGFAKNIHKLNEIE